VSSHPVRGLPAAYEPDELPNSSTFWLAICRWSGHARAPVFVDRFKDEIPGYMQKHLVKAGITGGPSQRWRGHTCLRTRLEHDLYYIENWSIWLT